MLVWYRPSIHLAALSGLDGRAALCGDRRVAAGGHALSHSAQLLHVPTPPQSRWRAATVIMFATDPLGVMSAYHQHLQDIDWPIPENTLTNQAITLLYLRVNPLPRRTLATRAVMPWWGSTWSIRGNTRNKVGPDHMLQPTSRTILTSPYLSVSTQYHRRLYTTSLIIACS